MTLRIFCCGYPYGRSFLGHGFVAFRPVCQTKKRAVSSWENKRHLAAPKRRPSAAWVFHSDAVFSQQATSKPYCDLLDSEQQSPFCRFLSDTSLPLGGRGSLCGGRLILRPGQRLATLPDAAAWFAENISVVGGHAQKTCQYVSVLGTPREHIDSQIDIRVGSWIG